MEAMKCGLEIHQELEGKKLFCYCPTTMVEEKEELTVRRRLRAVAGESGGIDIAAAYEGEQDRQFVYHAFQGEFCEVELDAAPPLPMNKEALRIALQFAKLLKMRIPRVIHVQRKYIVDGSNTSSFQRLAVIGVGTKHSFLGTSNGKVFVNQLNLEEDSCKILKMGKDAHYSLSRLGIPLLEVSTDASIQNGTHALEVATALGDLLRSLPGVKRGIGSIRQDVNISVGKHPRVELKGFQNIRAMQSVIEKEISRQREVLRKGKPIPHVRRVQKDNSTTFLRPLPGAARLYPETDIPVINPREHLKGLAIPKTREQQIRSLQKRGLSAQVARLVVHTGKLTEVEQYAERFSIPPAVVAAVLVEMPKELLKRFSITKERIQPSDIQFVLDAYAKKQVTRDGLTELLRKKIMGEHIVLEIIPEDELHAYVKQAVAQHPGATVNALMGMIMKQYRGQVNPQRVVALILKYQGQTERTQ